MDLKWDVTQAQMCGRVNKQTPLRMQHTWNNGNLSWNKGSDKTSRHAYWRLFSECKVNHFQTVSHFYEMFLENYIKTLKKKLRAWVHFSIMGPYLQRFQIRSSKLQRKENLMCNKCTLHTICKDWLCKWLKEQWCRLQQKVIMLEV